MPKEQARLKEQTPLLEVQHLQKYFHVKKGHVLKAVDDVSFVINRGETFGLVGESGCGKSTTGRTIIRLYDRTAGRVLFNGEDVHQMPKNRTKAFRRNMQMIFQDPYASLNPRQTVGEIIAEGMMIHRLYRKQERQQKVYELLEMVGLRPEYAERFPHEFSGGQRQRIGIARALAVDPEFIIADEPISALDVSVQAQIVNLLVKLKREKGLTFLFIAHDLAMVKHISDRIGVMYLGKMMETAPSEQLYRSPLHPYTKALLSAIPLPDPVACAERERIILEGEVPTPTDPPSGCVFRTRCPEAMDACAEHTPRLREENSGHFVACHLYK